MNKPRSLKDRLSSQFSRVRRRWRLPQSGTVECLESRIAPASFTGAATTLNIDLNTANEAITFHTDGTTITAVLTGGTATDGGGTTAGNVTGFGGTTLQITSSAFTAIAITDSAAGDSVAFTGSTGVFPQAFTITLNDAASGNVSFAGSSTFSASFNATTTAGFVSSEATSSLALTGGASNLTLTAAGHDVLLKGSVTVAGTTSLTGSVIQADHAANDFTGALSMTGPLAGSIFDSNDLTLGATSLSFGTLGQKMRIAAGGNITQSSALSAGTSTAASLEVVSTGGSIALTNAANTMGVNVGVSLSVTGANNVSLVNAPGTSSNLTLADVHLGTGTFSVTSNGSVLQKTGTTIQTDGAISVTLGAINSKDLVLTNSGNRIGGAVTVAEILANSLRDVSLRNAADNATAPTGAPLTVAGNLRAVTLFFDNAGVALPGYNTAQGLTVTAGGDITQTGALAIGGTATFTVLGDHAVNLTTAANTFSGSIGVNAQQSTQPIAIAGTGGLTLGTSNLGRGTFSATAVTGDITQSGSIAQEKGAAAATFIVTAGSSIALSNASNRLPGGVVFQGAGLTSVSLRNGDFTADFAKLTIPSTVTTLTVRFDNAPVVLPSLGAVGTPLASLTVNGQGIVQQAGTSINATLADFNANAFPLTLTNTNNDFTNVILQNSGRNDVAITDIDDLNFSAPSSLGSGRFTITAGTITDAANISQSSSGPAGEVNITSTSNVVLDFGHTFLGPVSVKVVGTNTATIANTAVPLTLGSISTGVGAFIATAGAQGIFQDPNSVLNFGGTSSFTTTGNGTVKLTNATNTFTGAVSLTAGEASLTGSGAVALGTSTTVGPLLVKAGGAITQTGAITAFDTATFDAGTASVTLTNAGNNFSSVSVFSTGPSVAITDANALNIGTLKLGGGTLNITTGGILGMPPGGSLVQTTGTGAITITTPAASNVTLDSALNIIRGSLNIVNSMNVTVQSQGDLTFAAGSAITGTLTATSGGVLALPSNLTTLTGLVTSAVSTTVSSDITATGNVIMSGAVAFTGTRAVTAATAITFTGDVSVTGPLTLNTASSISLTSGTWTQGAQPLTIPTTASLFIGDGGNSFARLITSSSITMNGGLMQVRANGTLQVGQSSSAETATIANGAGTLQIDGTLALGFGATNDQLLKTGSGVVLLGSGSRLVGTGLAGSTATPVLTSQTGLIAGRFLKSVDSTGAPHDFFAGSDIVSPAYTFTDVTVKSGGTTSSTGTISGFLPDGDRYTVASSLGASAGLAVVEETTGQLSVVVRNTAASAASKLTISTTGGGDGIIPINGVAINSPGAVTVTAPAADFVGSLKTVGTLASLTARDLRGVTVGASFLLDGGGAASSATSITAREVQLSDIKVAGTLASFKAVSAKNVVTLTAQKFGTITTTGSALGTSPLAPGTTNRGDFQADLLSTTTTTGPVLTSAKIAGVLGGTWDLRGSVGTVTAAQTESWFFGTSAFDAARNGGLLTDVKSLTLGPVNNSIFQASGQIGSLTTSDLTGSNITAGSFGTIKIVPTANGLPGILSNSKLTATGNVGGVAIKSLSVAGDVSSAQISLLDGDATAMTFARTVSNSTIQAVDINSHGNLKAITAGRWQSTDIAARTIGTLKVIGNFPAGLFGDFTGSDVSVSGNAKGVGLATLDVQGAMSSSNFDIAHGNVTLFKVGRQLGSTNVTLADPAFGTLGTIQAGGWASGVSVVAETIGTVASVGVPATASASPLIIGSLDGASINAYLNSGTVPAIRKFNVKGDLTNSDVSAERGIGSITVGRTVQSSFIVADDAQDTALNVGRVGTLTAGAWTGSNLSVNTLGVAKFIGFSQPEGSSTVFTPGIVTSGIFIAHGTTPTKTAGIDTFSVANAFASSSSLVAPFGIKTLSVVGTINTSNINAINPTTPASGFISSLTAGDVTLSNIRAGSVGTMKVTGNAALDLLGNLNSSNLALTSAVTTKTGPQALGSLTVAGDIVSAVIDAPASVGSITVLGSITSSASATRVQVAYTAGSKFGSLTAGAFGIETSNLTTDLVTQAIGSFTLKGNAARGLSGTTTKAFIDVLGKDSAGVGLGTFTASGTATNSLFRVNDGDVTSFTVLRFVSTDLLVGFRFDKTSDITATTASAQWSPVNHKIGTFKTTAPFDSAEVSDSASFVDSNVIAGILGSITIGGVNPDTINSTAFGVAFRTAAGASAAGVVKTNGSATALATPTTSGQFDYLGLAG